MVISRLTVSPELLALLTACELPVEDLAAAPNLQLFGCRIDGRLQAVVGLELYGREALLRSLAVAPGLRQAGLGQALVACAEDEARAHGVQHLYLLTTTAASFFARLAYAPCPRDQAPEAIRGTAQFTGLCPASATFMGKRLAP